MPEVYDTEYESIRLSQLTEQYALAHDIDGKVIFRSSPDENRLETATWVLNDDDYAHLRDSNFKSMLLPLIDNLITYRTRWSMQNCREGYVALSKSKATITWLPDGEGEALAAASKATDKKEVSNSFEGYLDSSFDEAFEALSLKWLPWVGSEYLKAERRTIVLGESIYLYGGEANRQKILHRDSLRVRHLNNGILAKNKSRYLRNLERAIFQKKHPSVTERKKLWTGVIYHNLVLRMMEKRKNRPTYNDYFTGWKSFLQLATVVQVQQCVVYGIETLKIDALLDLLGEQNIAVHRTNLPKVGKYRPLTLTFQLNDQTLQMLFILHPSAFFSWRKWALTLRETGMLSY